LVEIGPLPILLVDDRRENLTALEAVLAPLGHPLSLATSGARALRMLLERDYAVILLDVRMPGLDGLETARLIKGRERTRDTPILFLTAAPDEVDDIVRGYEVGAVDYVLKPFDPELLRSKVAIFVELEESRRALQRSEALLRASFDYAPIGKTVLDGELRIVRDNQAFAALLRRDANQLGGVEITELCHPDDREALRAVLERVARGDPGAAAPDTGGVDLRLRSALDTDVWVALVASAIERSELGEPLLLAQWIDLSARRRAEEARAELLLEQSARTQAEAIAERLRKLETLSDALGSLSLEPLLEELAIRLTQLFEAVAGEVRIRGGGEEEPIVVLAAGGRVLRGDEAGELRADGTWVEAPLQSERRAVGSVRLCVPAKRRFSSAERSLLRDAAGRAALAVRQAQLYEQEHRNAVELQRGLLPKRLPTVAGLQVVAHYQAAGGVAEVGGDWYDAFALSGGRMGIVVGDVAGRGIPAASTMGQLRSVTRALALQDDEHREPGEVLTRLNRYQLALGEEQLFTIVYAIVDPREMTITWANAGHLPPLHRAQSGETTFLRGGAYPMGIDDVEYNDLSAPLHERDVLMLYTDGLVERRGESIDAGLERLAQAAASGPATPQELSAHILDRVLPPADQLHDDVTSVVAAVT
jgi:PAS domain S-box-containing protein